MADDLAGKGKQLRQGNIATYRVEPIPGGRVHLSATNWAPDDQRERDSSKQFGVLLAGFSHNRHVVQLQGNPL